MSVRIGSRAAVTTVRTTQEAMSVTAVQDTYSTQMAVRSKWVWWSGWCLGVGVCVGVVCVCVLSEYLLCTDPLCPGGLLNRLNMQVCVLSDCVPDTQASHKVLFSFSHSLPLSLSPSLYCSLSLSLSLSLCLSL